MALQKSIYQNSGVETAYHRVARVSVTVEQYTSQADRDAGKAPVTSVVFSMFNDGSQCANAAMSELYPLIRQCNPLFTDAEDV